MNYSIRNIEIQDLKEALDLVWDVFLEFEAPDYNERGVHEFKEFIKFDSIKQKMQESQFFIWGCFDEDKVIGVLAMRPPCHISLLFVDKEYHKRGIARAMLDHVIEYYNTKLNYLEMTVNSSPYAINIYHKLGFEDVDKEQVVNGIRFTPMKRLLK